MTFPPASITWGQVSSFQGPFVLIVLIFLLIMTVVFEEWEGCVCVRVHAWLCVRVLFTNRVTL